MRDSIKSALDDSLKLYSLPQTLVQVLKVVSDETSGADDLAKVLMKDPALTTRVLKVVNSPFYGAGRKIGTVSQATVTLGMRQVTALAVSTSIYGMTENWQSELDRVRFWRHSLEVAIAARLIAEQIGLRQLEEIYVAGLLHDIGLLVLERSFPEQFATIWRQASRGESLVDLEEEAWGTNHSRVGQFLLEQWRLPDSICEAVGRHHHTYPEGADEEDFVVPQIVSLAGRIARFRIAETQRRDETILREEREIMRTNLRLDARDLLAIERVLFTRTVEESRYLDMDIGTNEQILSEANQMLFSQYSAVENLLDENRRMHKQIAGEQVKTGFLESLKSTAATFTDYIDRASGSVIRKIREVQAGIKSGTIIDPSGVVADSARSIEADIEALLAVMMEMRKLTQTQSALYYDQGSVEAIEGRIRKRILQESEAIPAG